ncbi:hypothetical protein Ddye_014417, partial [Dipteronia dyeriana]
MTAGRAHTRVVHLKSIRNFKTALMELSKHFLFAILLSGFVLADFVRCQDQSGFISLDCGLPDGNNYTDINTCRDYISDAVFIETTDSNSNTIHSEFSKAFKLNIWFVRSFPENIINCYNIKVSNGTKYLIRATFMYGNYDSQNKVPEFELHLGPNL